LAVSVASEFDHAEQVVADVALLQEMAEGRLDDERVKQAAQVLLEHKRDELPSVSVAVAARLLGVSRTIIESWREAGVLTAVPVRRRRYQITIESIVRVQALLEELRRLGAATSFATTSATFHSLQSFFGVICPNCGQRIRDMCTPAEFGRDPDAVPVARNGPKASQARAAAGCQARWLATFVLR
jgi:hypothetical protein